MRRVRGRPRHGSARKDSKTVSLDVDAIARLEKLGNGVLSTGIAIAEHVVRAMPIEAIARARLRLIEPREPQRPESWIVFTLVDGPPDPPEIPMGGKQLDAWRA